MAVSPLQEFSASPELRQASADNGYLYAWKFWEILSLLAHDLISFKYAGGSAQERALRASLVAEGKGLAATLDDAGIERFIQHYQRITQHILAEMPGRADLCIALDAERRPMLREKEKV
ncbi:hypothetical protein [Sphingomonas sp. SRS2]|uniref:hypothetical protein n=1 Tax=Sphingomonas sp. SRS2 TaxID=133190 RepID=UPI000A5BBEA4|nr:hypothetical protein [Sphingomonas sp. SRS2]